MPASAAAPTATQAPPDAPAAPGRTLVRDRRAPGRLVTSELGAKELAALPTVADALERLPAATVSTGRRGERTLALRGFSQRQAVVLLDGVPWEVPYDGQADLAPLPAASLARLAVLPAPASLRHGVAGPGGLVALETRWPGAGPLAAVGVEGQSGGGAGYSALHEAQAGPWAWRVSALSQQRGSAPLAGSFAPTALQPGGVRLNSDRRATHLAADVGWTPAPNQRLRLSAFHLDAPRGVPPSTVDPAPRHWRFSDWRALSLALVHEGALTPSLDTRERVTVRQWTNVLDSFDDATYRTQSTARAFRSRFDDLGVDAQLAATLRLPSLGEGLDASAHAALGYRYERHVARASTARGATGPAESVARDLTTATLELALGGPGGEQLSAGAVVDLEWPGAALAADPTPDLDGGGQLVGRLPMGKTLSVGASVARRARRPTLKDRVSTGLGARVPNPDLRPESAWTFGVDASWEPRPWLRLDVALFDAEATDLLELVPVGSGQEQLRNAGRARLAGVEVGGRVRPMRALSLSFGYAFTDARRLDGSDPRLADRPRHRASLALGAAAGPALDVDLTASLVGPRDEMHPVSGAWVERPGHVRLDARLEWRPSPGLALWGRVTNLFDAAIETSLGYPDPGREVSLGLRLTLGAPER